MFHGTVLDGRSTVLGTYAAEELLSHLVNSGLKIVERGMLDKVLAEQKLQRTGPIDGKTAKQVGKIAGVDALVTGSITDLQSSVGVNCRLIDTTTGEIFGAAQVKITKDDDVKKIMAVAMNSTAVVDAAPKAAPVAAAPTHTWTDGALSWSIEPLHATGNTLTASITVENSGAEGQRLTVGPFYLVDDNGDRWAGRSPNGYEYDYDNVAPGTRRRYRWVFTPQAAATGTIFTLADGQNTRALARNLTRKP